MGWGEGNREVKVKYKDGTGYGCPWRQAEGPEGSLSGCGSNSKSHRLSLLKMWTSPEIAPTFEQQRDWLWLCVELSRLLGPQVSLLSEDI